MSKITISSIGNFDRTTQWLAKMASNPRPRSLDDIGKMGVRALREATPMDSGETAAGWSYKVVSKSKGHEVVFYNSAHPQTRVPVALLIQYGHGTKNGGYVPPIDYINPALGSIFSDAGNKIAKELNN